MDHLKRTLDDGFRRLRGKIELVKKPHVSVKEWLETHIPTASSSLISLATLNEQSNSESSTTSGPSTCSNQDVRDAFHITEMPAKPSRFLSINVELKDVFEDDDGQRMRVILEKGLDPNFIDLQGKPLIYRAVEEKKYNILDTMLDFGFGCDINSTCQNDTNCGWATLHLSCHLGDLRAVEILLGTHLDHNIRRDSCDVNAVDVDGRNALHILASSPSWICNDGLICEQRKSNTKSDEHTIGSSSDSISVVRRSFKSKTALEKTPMFGTPVQAKIKSSGIKTRGSVSDTCEIDSFSAKHCSSPSPLTRAKEQSCSQTKPKDTFSRSRSSSSRHLSDHAQIMKLLIKAGCEVNRLDECNGTPLHVCATRGNLEGLKILLKNGADPGLVDSMCETPLIKAILQLHPQTTRTLLKMEHSLSDIKRFELSELLLTVIEDISSNPHEMNEEKVIEILKILLKKRIYLNVADCRRRTPLHLAVLYGYHSLALTIMGQPSCDLTKQDDEGFTPLFLAAWNPKKVGNNTHVIEALISQGACVEQHDCCGVFPVNAAIESGQYAHACALIAHGIGPKHVSGNRWFCASLDRLSRNSSTLPFVERFVLNLINHYRYSPCLLETAAILGKRDIMEQVVKAGADRSSVNITILQRWVQDDSQNYLAPELMDNIRLLAGMLKGPLSLKDLCRLEIRLYVGVPLHSNIECLPLPEVLRQFLKMRQYYQQKF